jgi:hypothetical protein
MNVWILSLLICGTTPMADGSYCKAMPLDYGLSREACQAEMERWRQHPSKPRLEYTEDPALSAMLEEGETDELESGEDEEELPASI